MSSPVGEVEFPAKAAKPRFTTGPRGEVSCGREVEEGDVATARILESRAQTGSILVYEAFMLSFGVSKSANCSTA